MQWTHLSLNQVVIFCNGNTTLEFEDLSALNLASSDILHNDHLKAQYSFLKCHLNGNLSLTNISWVEFNVLAQIWLYHS